MWLTNVKDFEFYFTSLSSVLYAKQQLEIADNVNREGEFSTAGCKPKVVATLFQLAERLVDKKIVSLVMKRNFEMICDLGVTKLVLEW